MLFYFSLTLCTFKHRKGICTYLSSYLPRLHNKLYYVRLSRNLYIDYVHLSRNLHIHYVRLGRNLYVHYVHLRPTKKVSNLRPQTKLWLDVWGESKNFEWKVRPKKSSLFLSSICPHLHFNGLYLIYSSCKNKWYYWFILTNLIRLVNCYLVIFVRN